MLRIDDALLAAWLGSLTHESSVNRNAIYAIRTYGSYLDDRRIPLDRTTAADVRRFAAKMSEEHTPGVTSYIVNFVKRLYRWLEREGLYRDVAEDVEAAKFQPFSREAVSAAEALRVLGCVKDARDRAILSLMFRCDFKSRDIVAAKVGGLLLLDGAGEIMFSNGSWMPLTRACAEELSEYVSWMGLGDDPEALLFSARTRKMRGISLSDRRVREIVQGAFRAAGMPLPSGACNAGSAAVELAIAEGEPPEVIVALCDRTHFYRVR